MSFFVEPTSSFWLPKQDGAAPPAGKFYAADANTVRAALLEVHDIFSGSVTGSVNVNGALTASTIIAPDNEYLNLIGGPGSDGVNLYARGGSGGVHIRQVERAEAIGPTAEDAIGLDFHWLNSLGEPSPDNPHVSVKNMNDARPALFFDAGSDGVLIDATSMQDGSGSDGVNVYIGLDPSVAPKLKSGFGSSSLEISASDGVTVVGALTASDIKLGDTTVGPRIYGTNDVLDISTSLGAVMHVDDYFTFTTSQGLYVRTETTDRGKDGHFFHAQVKEGNTMRTGSYGVGDALSMDFHPVSDTGEILAGDYPAIGVINIDNVNPGLFLTDTHADPTSLITLATGTISLSASSVNVVGALTASSGLYNGDIEVSGSANGMILSSPDGSRWRVSITDLGVFSGTKL